MVCCFSYQLFIHVEDAFCIFVRVKRRKTIFFGVSSLKSDIIAIYYTTHILPCEVPSLSMGRV